MTPLPSSPMPAATDPAPRKTWRVGTLSYTTAGLSILFVWLLWGDFAWSMKERTVGPVLQLLLKKFSASDTLTGVLMGSLPGIIGMILSPIVSYKSDHLRSRWGRRIPFLILSTPFAVLAMVGVAFSPVLGVQLDKALGPHSPGLDNATLIFLGIFWILFEFSTFVSYSVFTGLINDVVPQKVLGRFYGYFRILSLVAGIVFNYYLVRKAEAEYLWIFLGMGALYGGGFSLMCFKVREGEYPPPPAPSAHRGLPAFIDGAKDYFKECFSHSYYWWYFSATALSAASMLPITWYLIYFAKSMPNGMDLYAKGNILTYTISLFLAYPLGALVDRFHPLRACLVVQALFAVSCLWGGLFARDSETFFIALVIFNVISGMWWTVSASLGLRLLPRANFAQFGSAAGIVGNLTAILLAPVVGMFLDYSHHVYRYTFLISAGLGASALLVTLVLHHKFMAFGGPKNYVAPDGGTFQPAAPTP
jgi:MFS family permease